VRAAGAGAALAVAAFAVGGCGGGGDAVRAVPQGAKQIRAATDAVETGLDAALSSYRDGDRVAAADRIARTLRDDLVPLARALGPAGEAVRRAVAGPISAAVDAGTPVSGLARRIAAAEAALHRAAARAGRGG
jgi:hypothetical protein